MKELDEFRFKTYENIKLYKGKTKKWHDQRIKRHEFHESEEY